MKRLSTFLATAAVLLMPLVPAKAQVIGAPAENGNCFPFACLGVGYAGTRYQQVYRASQFSGPVNISSISFFLYAGSTAAVLNSGTFTFYLSTTTVGTLTNAFDSNRGANNALFGSYTLGGVAPNVLSFNGSSFLYNPADGDLLMDIVVSGATYTPTTSVGTYYDARSGATGVFGRMHDFGVGFEGYGLVTEFNRRGLTTVPEPSTYALMAAGLAGMLVVARRRKRA